MRCRKVSESVESIGSMEVDKKLLVVEGECGECGVGVKDRGTNVEDVIAAAANSVLGTGFMARALTPHRRTCAAAAAISEPSLCPRLSRHGSKQSRKDLRQHIHTRSGVS
jgi:hypothetical protein